MILTSAAGMFLAVPGMVPLDVLILGNLGIALVAGSGAAVNHLIDRKVDSLMKRTLFWPDEETDWEDLTNDDEEGISHHRSGWEKT